MPSELPPDHKLIIVDQREDDLVVAGDLFVESGPRIGERFWLVVSVEDKTLHTHCVCVKANGMAIPADTRWWRLTRN